MFEYMIIPFLSFIILNVVLVISDLSDKNNHRIFNRISDFYKDDKSKSIKILSIYIKHKRIKEIKENKIYYLMSDKNLKELYLTDKEVSSMDKLKLHYNKCINLLNNLDFKFKTIEEYTTLADKFLKEPTSVKHIELNITNLQKLYEKIEEQHYINYKNKKEENKKKEINSIFAKDKKHQFMTVLGLNINSEIDLKSLKKQYRKLSMKYHPDKFINIKSEIEKQKINDRFVEINNAYEYLLKNYI